MTPLFWGHVNPYGTFQLAIGVTIGLGISCALIALVRAISAAIARNNVGAAQRRQARQQQWEQEMLATKWGQDIMAARQQFLRDCFPGR